MFCRFAEVLRAQKMESANRKSINLTNSVSLKFADLQFANRCTFY
jgi:hypothetical protein